MVVNDDNRCKVATEVRGVAPKEANVTPPRDLVQPAPGKGIPWTRGSSGLPLPHAPLAEAFIVPTIIIGMFSAL